MRPIGPADWTEAGALAGSWQAAGPAHEAAWVLAEPAPDFCVAAAESAEPASFTWVQAAASADVSHALAWTLAHSLWVGASAAILLAGFLRLAPARRARLRYGACLAALASVPLAAALTLARELFLRPEPIFLSLDPAAGIGGEAGGALGLLTAWAGAARASLGALLAPVENWIAGAWILLATLALARVAGGWAWLARKNARELTRAAPRLQARLARLARGIGLRRPVGLYWSRTADVPMVVGVLRPRVVVPSRLIAAALRGELDLVLRHELAHVRRRDGWFRTAEAVLQALFAVHPILPWIAARAAREREHCCDDLALAGGADRVAYLKSLAALESQRSLRAARRCNPLRERFAVAGALHATDGELLERVRRLATRAPRPHRARTVLASAAVVLGGAGLSLGALPSREAPPRILARGGAALAHELAVERELALPVDHALPANFALLAGHALPAELALSADLSVPADLWFERLPDPAAVRVGLARPVRTAGAFVLRARTGRERPKELKLVVQRELEFAFAKVEPGPKRLGLSLGGDVEFVKSAGSGTGATPRSTRNALRVRALKPVR